MTQRLDSENELVTSTSDGLVIFWDCDEVNPVQAIDVGSHQKLSCARISPSGRCGAVAVPRACPPFLLSHLRNQHLFNVLSCWRGNLFLDFAFCDDYQVHGCGL